MPAAALPVPVPSPPPATRPRRHQHGIVGQLNREWDRLSSTSAHDQQVRSWARQEKALSEAATLADLEQSHRQDRDRTLAALLRVAHRGSELAATAVLYLMLGDAVQLTGRTFRHADRSSEEDHRAHVISCLWQAIRAYPVGRHDAGTYSRLSLDTLKQVTGDCRRRSLELVLSPPSALTSLVSSPLHDDEPADDEVILKVLHWGVERGHITADEARTSFMYHSPADPRRGADVAHDIATELGISTTALRQRLSRSTRRLRDAVQEATARGDQTLRTWSTEDLVEAPGAPSHQRHTTHQHLLVS